MGWYKLEKGQGQIVEAAINTAYMQEYYAENPETKGVVTAYTHCIELDEFDFIIQTEVTKRFITEFIEVVDTLPLPDSIFIEEIDENTK